MSLPYRVPTLVTCLLLAGCGLKAPLLLPGQTAAPRSTPAGEAPAAGSTAPLCAGGTSNGTVQGVCQ